MFGPILRGVNNSLQLLLARLTAARAGYLDNLNVGGTVAPAATALSTAVWTSGRAANLDNINSLLVPQLGALGRPQFLMWGTPGTYTFTAPKTSWYRFYIRGGGGSGAVAHGLTTNSAKAQGGCGGAFGIKDAYLTQGQSCTITVGAGGTGLSTNYSAVTATAGNNGGYSQVVGPSSAWTAQAGGGLGGQATTTLATTLAKLTAATTSGCDWGVNGGRSGAITTNSGSISATATGGGSCGSLYGTGSDSGDATTISAQIATGGAGLYAGSSNNSTLAGQGFPLPYPDFATYLLQQPNPFLYEYFQPTVTTYFDGAGSAGSTVGTGGAATKCGGTGAAVISAGASATSSVIWGSGSGGASIVNTGQANCITGTGGSGAVAVEF